jgi:hypothetical protein
MAHIRTHIKLEEHGSIDFHIDYEQGNQKQFSV